MVLLDNKQIPKHTVPPENRSLVSAYAVLVAGSWPEYRPFYSPKLATSDDGPRQLIKAEKGGDPNIDGEHKFTYTRNSDTP